MWHLVGNPFSSMPYRIDVDSDAFALFGKKEFVDANKKAFVMGKLGGKEAHVVQQSRMRSNFSVTSHFLLIYLTAELRRFAGSCKGES